MDEITKQLYLSSYELDTLLSLEDSEAVAAASSNEKVTEAFKAVLMLGKNNVKGEEEEGEQGGVSEDQKSVVLNQIADTIGKYLKYFPGQNDEAIDCLLELIEGGESKVRSHVIKMLPLLCLNEPDEEQKSKMTLRVADTFNQLLVQLDSDEDAKHDVVRAYHSLLEISIKDCLTALFNQISSDESEEQSSRKECVAFLEKEVMKRSNKLIFPNAEVEELLSGCIEKLLPEASADEFKTFVNILKRLKIFHEETKRNELVEMISSRVDLSSEPNLDDEEFMTEFVHIARATLSVVQQGGKASKFLRFISTYMLPKLDSMSQENQVAMVELLARLSVGASGTEVRMLLPQIVSLLNGLMVAGSIKNSQEEEEGKGKEVAEEESEGEQVMNFLVLESLLYSLHRLAFRVKGFLNPYCGYRYVTGQISDKLNQNTDDIWAEWHMRLSSVASRAKKDLRSMETVQKQLGAAMSETRKAAEAAQKAAVTLGNAHLLGESSSSSGDSVAAFMATVAELKTKLDATRMQVRAMRNVATLVAPLMKRVPEYMGESEPVVLSFMPQKRSNNNTQGKKKTVGNKGSSSSSSSNSNRNGSGTKKNNTSNSKKNAKDAKTQSGGKRKETKAVGNDRKKRKTDQQQGKGNNNNNNNNKNNQGGSSRGRSNNRNSNNNNNNGGGRSQSRGRSNNGGRNNNNNNNGGRNNNNNGGRNNNNNNNSGGRNKNNNNNQSGNSRGRTNNRNNNKNNNNGGGRSQSRGRANSNRRR